jgi:hypothetical protein
VNQNLETLLKTADAIPEILVEFSDTVKDALTLRIGAVSSKDPHAVQFYLDEIDAATAEVSRLRADASYAQADVQHKMRCIQREYVTQPGLKVTQAERLYKIDQNHRELEALLTKLVATVTYCDTVENLLKNKWFELKGKSRA